MLFWSNLEKTWQIFKKTTVKKKLLFKFPSKHSTSIKKNSQFVEYIYPAGNNLQRRNSRKSGALSPLLCNWFLWSSVSNGRPYCYSIVSHYFSCQKNFSDTARSIFVKLTGVIDDDKIWYTLFVLMTSLPVAKHRNFFLIFQGVIFPRYSR